MVYVKEKMGKRLGLQKRTMKFISQKARPLFYNSIIQPILDYGAVAWGSNTKRHVQDIVKLQKRCARIILDKEIIILPFDKRLEYLRNISVFKALNNLSPNYIRAMFTMASDIHNAGTRNAKHNLMLIKVRFDQYGQNCFQVFSSQELERTPKRHQRGPVDQYIFAET